MERSHQDLPYSMRSGTFKKLPPPTFTSSTPSTSTPEEDGSLKPGSHTVQGLKSGESGLLETFFTDFFQSSVPGLKYSHSSPTKEAPVTRHPSSERIHEILKELGDLHDRKQKDYGRPTDPFANVRGSSEWGLKPWVGAMLRATDKLRRLQTYAATGTLSNETAIDSFNDLAVYAIIARVLYEEEQGGPKD